MSLSRKDMSVAQLKKELTSKCADLHANILIMGKDHPPTPTTPANISFVINELSRFDAIISQIYQDTIDNKINGKTDFTRLLTKLDELETIIAPCIINLNKPGVAATASRQLLQFDLNVPEPATAPTIDARKSPPRPSTPPPASPKATDEPIEDSKMQQVISRLKKDLAYKCADLHANLKIALSEANDDDPTKNLSKPIDVLLAIKAVSDTDAIIWQIYNDATNNKINNAAQLNHLLAKLDELQMILNPCIKNLKNPAADPVAFAQLDKFDLTAPVAINQAQAVKTPNISPSSSPTQLKKKSAFRYQVGRVSDQAATDAAKKREIAIALVKSSDIDRKFRDEIIARIIDPSCMDQERNALCGPTTFLMQLAELDPIKFADTAIKLIKDRKVTIVNEKSGETLFLENKYTDAKLQKRSIDMVFLSALRRDANRINIYASSKSAGSFAESVMGYTKPEDFVKWYKAFFDECEIKDTTQIYEKGGKPLSSAAQKLAGIRNNPDYADMDKNLDMSIKHLQDGYSTNMLVTMGLADLILRIDNDPKNPASYIYNKDDDHYAPIVGVEFGHYIKINQLEKIVDKDGKPYVHIVMDTWTKEYDAKVPYDEFMKGYRGCIIAKPAAALEQKLEVEEQASPKPLRGRRDAFSSQHGIFPAKNTAEELPRSHARRGIPAKPDEEPPIPPGGKPGSRGPSSSGRDS